MSFLLDFRRSKHTLSMQATLSDVLSGSCSNTGKGKLPCSVPRKHKQSSAGSTSLGRTTWDPPPAGWTKVNIDGSFVSQTGAAGVGVIARDSQRRIIFTAWCSFSGVKMQQKRKPRHAWRVFDLLHSGPKSRSSWRRTVQELYKQWEPKRSNGSPRGSLLTQLRHS